MAHGSRGLRVPRDWEALQRAAGMSAGSWESSSQPPAQSREWTESEEKLWTLKAHPTPQRLTSSSKPVPPNHPPGQHHQLWIWWVYRGHFSFIPPQWKVGFYISPTCIFWPCGRKFFQPHQHVWWGDFSLRRSRHHGSSAVPLAYTCPFMGQPNLSQTLLDVPWGNGHQNCPQLRATDVGS